MSGAALKFYEREFSFFKKVTSISGIIRCGYNNSNSQASYAGSSKLAQLR